MQKMTISETKITLGGALSGSLVSGFAAIIDAITNFITSMAGLAYIFEETDGFHSQGDFKFSKNLSFSWDDTKPKADNVAKIDLNNHQINAHDVLISHAYDLA